MKSGIGPALRFRLRQKITPMTMAARRTTQATTIPAMGPALLLLLWTAPVAEAATPEDDAETEDAPEGDNVGLEEGVDEGAEEDKELEEVSTTGAYVM